MSLGKSQIGSKARGKGALCAPFPRAFERLGCALHASKARLQSTKLDKYKSLAISRQK